MPCCAIVGCTSSTHRKDQKEVSFHRFPTNNRLKKIWINKCGRKDKINTSNATVCSRHFLPSDYSKFHEYYHALQLSHGHHKRRLQKGAVPSQQLPRPSSNHQPKATGQQQKEGTASRQDAADSSDEERAKRRRENLEARKERQEKRERKELVERLLAEYEQKQQEELHMAQVRQLQQHAAPENVQPQPKKVSKPKPIKPAPPQMNPVTYWTLNPAATKPVPLQVNTVPLQQNPVVLQQNPVALQQNPVALQQNPVALQRNTVAQAATKTGIKIEGHGTVPTFIIRPTASSAGAGTASAAGTSSPDAGAADDAGAVDDDMGDDRPPSDDDAGAAPAGGDSDTDSAGSDREEGPTPQAAPLVTGDSILARALMAQQRKAVKFVTFKTHATALSSAYRKPVPVPDVTIQRTKEIMRLKQRVRQLEAQCLRVLRAKGPARAEDKPLEDGKAAGNENQGAKDGSQPTNEGQATNDGSQETKGTPSAAAGRASLGDGPLVILRNERKMSSRYPSILKYVSDHKLSDSVVTFVPSNMQEARQANYQMQVQYLNLQAAMLKWAMKNKTRTDRQRESEIKAKEKIKEQASTVRASRLRQLLRLESAVKAIFTESQIRALIRNHREMAEGVPPRKRGIHWSEEDFRRMLELRAISSDAVIDHVRDKMKIPIPTLRSAKSRFKRAPELRQAYKEMLEKSESERSAACSMCKSAMTINEVANLGNEQPDPIQESLYGRQFMQQVGEHRRDPVGAGPHQRHRTVPTAKSASKTKKRSGGQALDWFTSDSDGEMSDHVPNPLRIPTAATSKGRHRNTPMGASPSKAKKRRRESTVDWPMTSDSDGELSDTGVWGNLVPLQPPPAGAVSMHMRRSWHGPGDT